MGFRVRKSFKIAPGIRLTVTPKTIGISAGVKGARISANSSGRVTRTVGLPGTGIYHTETLSSGNSSRRPQPSHRSKSSRRTNSAGAPRPASKPIPAPRPPAPGLFAPKWEKELYKAVLGAPDYASLARIGTDYPPARPLASLLEATLVSVPAGDIQRGLELMSWLFSTGYDPARDEFVQKYLSEASFTLAIADGVTVQLPLTRNLIGLLLGELLQAADNISAAVDVVEQVEPGTVAAVSLAELYAKQGRWDDVVDLTEGLSNVDEAATFLLIQRGMAFRELGYFDAARESFKEALRIRSRPPELRQRALVERGLTHLRDGKRSLARKDFEKVLAENSSYPGLREHLAELEG